MGSLSDYAALEANVLAICRCGRRGVLDSAKLARWYFVHRWNGDVEVAGLHLRCSACGRRPATLRPTPKPPDRPGWMASDSDWRRLVKVLRD